MDLVPVPFGWCRAVVTDRDGKEVEHQVRVGDLLVGADETAGLEVVGDSRTATEQPLKSNNRGAPPCEHRRERNRLLDRKSTRLKLQSRGHLVCRLLLEKKKQQR